MEITIKHISELKKNPVNVRKHSRKQIEEYAKSIKMFGQIKPIVCDENGVVWCGNGLYDALIFAGIETAECYVYTGLTEKQKKKLMLADNKVYELGATDLSGFDELIREIGDFNIPGFDENLLKLIADSSHDAENALLDYGKDENPSDDVQERKEQAEFGKTAMQLGGVSPYAPVSEIKKAGVAHVDSGDERPYVVCPKCGEKIWL